MRSEMVSEWSNLNTAELGKYSKVYIKEKFKEMGFNIIECVNASQNIDFYIKNDDKTYKFKVKSLRKPNTSYAFIPKDRFDVNDKSLFMVLVMFYKDYASIFIIPAQDWLNENRLLRNREYKGKKSKPEWGLNVSEKNMDLLDDYKLQNMLCKINN